MWLSLQCSLPVCWVSEGTAVQFFGAGVDSVLILHYVKLQYFFVTLTKAGVI